MKLIDKALLEDMKDKWRIHEAKDKRSSKKSEVSHNEGKRNEIPSMWEKEKCASSLKNLKFIISRGIQGSSKREFIKKGKDSSSIEMCKHIKARRM